MLAAEALWQYAMNVPPICECGHTLTYVTALERKRMLEYCITPFRLAEINSIHLS